MARAPAGLENEERSLLYAVMWVSRLAGTQRGRTASAATATPPELRTSARRSRARGDLSSAAATAVGKLPGFSSSVGSRTPAPMAASYAAFGN